MQKKTMGYGLGALVAVGLALAWAFAPRPIEVELASATEARFETTVDEDGKIEVIGPNFDEIEEGGSLDLGILIEVAGRKIQTDFALVMERQCCFCQSSA